MTPSTALETLAIRLGPSRRFRSTSSCGAPPGSCSACLLADLLPDAASTRGSSDARGLAVVRCPRGADQPRPGPPVARGGGPASTARGSGARDPSQRGDRDEPNVMSPRRPSARLRGRVPEPPPRPSGRASEDRGKVREHSKRGRCGERLRAGLAPNSGEADDPAEPGTPSSRRGARLRGRCGRVLVARRDPH